MKDMFSISNVDKMWYYLWKLIFLSIIFIFSAPFNRFIGLAAGIILTIYAFYISWCTFKAKKYFGVVFSILFSVFGIRFTAFPITHMAFKYDENRQIVLIPHEHYMWEVDHVH